MRYKECISLMTIEEKAAMMSGKGFWETVEIENLGIPSIFLSDGPHGIRKQAGESDHLGLNASVPATCFPTAAGMANTWNPELIEAVGRYLGKEAKIQNVNIVLGPGLNIKRSPLCGRNFEYFSEDPYLSGRMAAGMIRGIQSEGVAACPKHFAVNSQELRRMSNDSILDERTFREIYATGFEIAVKEGKAKTIMSSYNKINGIYANENEHLLRDILVNEWGFDGFVVSDWGASNDHVLGVKAGSHLEMPTTGEDGKKLILDAIKDGRLTEALLDERIDEMLNVIFAVTSIKPENTTFDIEKHHAKAKKASEESIVLLKNEDQILPLKKEQSVVLIGDFARKPRFQGAGSSQVNPTKVDNALDLIKRKCAEFVGYTQGYYRNGKMNKQLKENAVKLASQAEVVLFYLGLGEAEESEGVDRTHLRIAPNQINVLEAVAEVNPNIVVILAAGGVVEMPWVEKVKGLIHGYLPGQAGAESILNIIYGEICPSGRLAETYPIKLEDTPCNSYYPGMEKTSEYREGIFVGYRYYASADILVRFPFGYGLSYTSFAYDKLILKENKAIINLTNTGSVSGAEVVQMYISAPDSVIFRPKRELKGFTKVYLQPGESITVEIPFDEMTFRYYNVKTMKWEIEKGTYSVQIGKNVNEIMLEETIEIQGTNAEGIYGKTIFEPYFQCNVKKIEDTCFEAMLGRKIPESKWDVTRPLEMNDTICQMYYAKSMIARLILKMIEFERNRSLQKGEPNLNLNFIYNIPFRGIAKMMGGAVTMKMAEAILEIVNGHFWKGIGRIVAEYFRNNRIGRHKKKDFMGGK